MWAKAPLALERGAGTLGPGAATQPRASGGRRVGALPEAGGSGQWDQTWNGRVHDPWEQIVSLIECRGLVKAYRLGDEEVRALDGVELMIAEGEFVAICGPSGSGKSTLANIIGGLDRPDAGTVSVAGRTLAQASDKELALYRNREVGFIFQSFHLQSHETALENVMAPLVLGGVGSRRDRRERALAALERVGLAERAKHRPNQLSGGQRQRVAIARALVNEPSLVLADEPTGNLDSVRGAEVMAELTRLHGEGLTLIVITHDAAVAAQAQRTVEIRDGRLTELTPTTTNTAEATR